MSSFPPNNELNIEARADGERLTSEIECRPDVTPMTETADAELAVLSRDDPEAFALLYYRYRDRIYRYVRMKTTSNDDALDVCQQIFTKAFDSIARYRTDQAPFASWLFGVARHAISDFLRHAPSITYQSGEHAMAPTDVEREVMSILDVERVKTLLAQLPDRKRDLLALRFAAQLTVPEISRLTGRKPDAVYKQLQRTIEQLRGTFYEFDA